MSRKFPILPPELWELIIKEHHLYGLEYIKTIKTIPSRHCIISTVYNQLIQPYIDNICKLIYSKNTQVSKNIISKPHIFNIKNLIDIICYVTHNMKIDGYPNINENYGGIKIQMRGSKFLNEIERERILRLRIVYISPYSIVYKHGVDDLIHRIGGPAVILWYYNSKDLSDWIGNNQSGSVGTDLSQGTTNRTGNSVASNQSGSVGTDLSQGITNRTGNKESEEYYIDGIRHRIGSPAVIRWDESGSIIKEKYYLNGIEVFKN